MAELNKTISVIESWLKQPVLTPPPINELYDALELLKEREEKTGHWIESKCLDECFWVCSECNFPSEAIIAPKLYKYCPNCGTKMKEQAVKWE